MQKNALTAYLINNNLDASGVYGFYEFNTGFLSVLYNNYYSGQNFVISSVTGISVVSGGSGYAASNGINNSGDIISIYGEQKNIPFEIAVGAGGVITSAYIDAGNVGGNVEGNVAGNIGIYTGVFYETPTYTISNTTGENAVLEFKMYSNYIYGTRYDLNPLVQPRSFLNNTSGVVNGALNTSLGSGYFTGTDSLKVGSGFIDDNWTMFIDYKSEKNYAPGKSKILLTSYQDFTSAYGFALTIDDANHLNFEYRDSSNSVQNYPTNLELQEYNIVSISRDSSTNSILIGHHDLSENKHNFDKLELNYSTGSDLYIGGIRLGYYANNTGYTGFSGYIDEILILNQSCDSDQLTALSDLFSITGYDAATTGTSTYYYPLITGVDTNAQLYTTGANVGYYLYSGNPDSAGGYQPSGITGELIQTGTIIYYDPINSGSSTITEDVPEAFYFNQSKKNIYAPKYFSFENQIENTDALEFYSFDSHSEAKTSDLEVRFTATPGKLYYPTGITGVNINFFDNGVYQVSGEDYNLYVYRSVVDTNSYTSYSNNVEDDLVSSSVPNEIYEVSGFDFVPSASTDYTYSNFPYDVSNNTGYFLYLNGQKLIKSGDNTFDYQIVGADLVINNSLFNYETGRINIAAIRSGSSRNYVNSYGVVGGSFYTTGFSNGVIDEVVFLNGQRLKRDFDYYKVSSGNLKIKTASVANQSYPFFAGETGFFNV